MANERLSAELTLEDRVSEKLRRMELQGAKLDRQMEKLGSDIDDTFGSRRQKNVDATNVRITNTAKSTAVATATVKGLGVAFAALKLPAIAAGFGFVSTAVVDLGGGLLGLASTMRGLPALATPVISTYAGVGGALVSTKLATLGLDKALKGFGKTLKEPTHETRMFAREVRTLEPMIGRLRDSAQSGLFPGLGDSIADLRKMGPALQSIVGGFGRRTGSLASWLTGRLSSPKALNDLKLVSDQAGVSMERAGKSAGYLGGALAQVLIAGRPFIDWATKGVLAMSRWTEQTAATNRENGKLGTFFSNAQQDLSRWGRIFENTTKGVLQVLKASQPLGDNLLVSMEAGSERFYQNTLANGPKMRAAFLEMADPIKNMAHFVGDVAAAMYRISRSPAFDSMLGSLQKSVPYLEKAATSLYDGFGPHLGEIVENLAKLASNVLPMMAGPLGTAATAMSGILSTVNSLIEKVPALGQLIATAFSLRLMSKWVGRAREAAGAMSVVGGAASGGTVAAGAGGTTVPAGGLRGGLAGGVRGAGAAGGARNLAYSAGALVGGGIVGGRALLGGAARLAGPMVALGGLTGALQGSGGRGLGGFAQNVLSGASFGLLMPSTSKQDAQMQARLQANMTAQGNAVQRGVSRVKGRDDLDTANRQIAYLGDIRNGAYGGTDKDARATRALIDGEIRARRELLPQLRAEHNVRRQNSGASYADRSGRALRYETRRAGAQRGLHNYVTDTLGQLRGSDANDPRARVIANSALDAARAAAKSNPKLVSEYERLRKGVGDKFSAMGAQAKVVNNRVLTSTREDWGRISRELTDPLERARQRNKTQWTAIQRDAYYAMQLSGLDPKRARREIRDAEKNHRPVRSADAVTAADQRAAARRGSRVTAGARGAAMGALNPLAGLFGGGGKRQATPAWLKGSGVFGQGGKGGVNVIQGALAALAKPIGNTDLARMRASADKAASVSEKAAGRMSTAAKSARRDVVAAAGLQSQQVVLSNQQIERSSEQRWPAIQKAMVTNAQKAQTEVTTAFAAIQTSAFNQLRTMGLSPAQAKKLAAGAGAAQASGRGKDKDKKQLGGRLGYAGGGRLHGRGLEDTIPVGGNALAAPGEMIVNRHQEQRLNTMLAPYGKTLEGVVSNERKKHNEPMAFARGGRSKSGGVAASHPELHAGIAKAAQAVLSKYPGLSITSTTGGGHAANSYHYKGEAADIGGSTQLMNQAASWIKGTMGKSLTEGIHNPNLSIKGGKSVPSSFWGSTVWGAHANHIHIAVAGALGALKGVAGGGGVGGGSISLSGKKSKVPGVSGSLSERASSLYAKGLEQQINKKLAVLQPKSSGGDSSDIASFGASSWNAELSKIAKSKHWDAAAWRWIVQHESGGNPNAVNGSSGATGLGQMLGGNIAKYNGKGTPVQQIDGMARYIQDRYGNPTKAKSFWQAHNWYAQGGRLRGCAHCGGDHETHQHGGRRGPENAGWFKTGGTVTASKPTVLGIGEAGTETATITRGEPKHGPKAGLVIEKLTVHNNREGDTERQITAAIERAWNNYARGIERNATGDEELHS